MRKITLCGLVLLFAMQLRAQAGIGTTAPHASAALDITSQNAGLLTPRMTTTERDAIVSPEQGLLVYDTDAKGFYGYTGTKWTSVMFAPQWSDKGNDITTDNFIGTTDANAVNFRTNNILRMSIATTTQLMVTGPDISLPRLVVERASDNTSHPSVYSEYSGGFGTTPFPAYYIAANTESGPVKGNYSFSATKADALIGNSIAGFSYVEDTDGTSGLSFYGGGHPSDINDRSLERLKITSVGNVGIGVTNPKTKLEVNNGDMYISNTVSGLVTKSPSGACWRTTVNNDGTFTTTTIPCL